MTGEPERGNGLPVGLERECFGLGTKRSSGTRY